VLHGGEAGYRFLVLQVTGQNRTGQSTIDEKDTAGNCKVCKGKTFFPFKKKVSKAAESSATSTNLLLRFGPIQEIEPKILIFERRFDVCNLIHRVHIEACLRKGSSSAARGSRCRLRACLGECVVASLLALFREPPFPADARS
jgi:hypothetical protein